MFVWILTNQARRTVRYDVKSAWKALLEMKDLKEVLGNEILLSARAEVYEEVGKHIYTPPEFSKDGKIAVFRIHSAAQIHPLIAARWVSTYYQLLPLFPIKPRPAPGGIFSNSHISRPA